MNWSVNAEAHNSRRSRSVASIAATGLLACAMTALGVSAATADPATDAKLLTTSVTAPDGSRITDTETIDDRNIRLQVYSAAMDKTFPVEIQRPADTSKPRPSLYLLSGAGGGIDIASWQAQSDARAFMADKDVNLILPIGGMFSYYTDWIKDDPVLGRNKWKTYLTEELPPIIDAALGTNGVNGIAGISTSATTVLALPIAKPGLYNVAAAYSGCAQTSDPLGSRFVKFVVDGYGGASHENMWGPTGSREWIANDPYVNAEGLRGTELYISSGNGMPGRYDTLDGPHTQPGPNGLANQIIIGGLIEAATAHCTQNLKTKLDSLGIPATFTIHDTGTHSWGYWQDELKLSWPTLAHGMGVKE
ncbi:alpha/beta hydrolase [Nocardia brasiliensis]|uniref:alpha/beta hydrolase n=2 Tax=Nocardia brasiliensis TaxID=37326 RepID=UPI00031F86E2